MKLIAKILAFLTKVADAWNGIFGGEKTRKAQEKQKTEAVEDNREAREQAARKAESERKRELKDLQGGSDW